MSWLFERKGSCELFDMSEASPAKGDPLVSNIVGQMRDENGDVLTYNHLTFMCGGRWQVDTTHGELFVDGFEHKSAITGKQQCYRTGLATVRLLSDIGRYTAMMARDGRWLDYVVLKGEIGGPPLEFTPPKAPCYVVPLIGDVMVGEVTLPEMTIAARMGVAKIEVQPITDEAVTVCVWERDKT